jgi:hypothetical protein
MYVFRNGASSSTREGSIFLCRRYVCCTVVSARVCIPAVTASRALWILCILCHCSILSKAYRGFLSMQVCAAGYAWTYATTLETAVNQLNGRWPSLSLLYFLCLVSPWPIPRIFGFFSKSELLLDGRFTANQFFLASSPLRPTTRGGPHRNCLFHYCIFCLRRGNNVSTEVFPSNGCCTFACLHRRYLEVGLYVTVY